MTDQHKKKILTLAVFEILARHNKPAHFAAASAAEEIAEYFFEREERIRERTTRDWNDDLDTLTKV